MRRIPALAAALGLAVSTAAVAAPAQTGYYVIRWDNTGFCQIWNTEFQQKPTPLLSDYKIVSKPVPTFAAAAAEQDKLRAEHQCTL